MGFWLITLAKFMFLCGTKRSSVSPRSQFGFPRVLPTIINVRMAASTWPSSLPLQLELSWPVTTLYQCDQQLPVGLRLAVHAALSNGGRRSPDVAAEGAMVEGVAVVLAVGAALSLATSVALVDRTVCN